MRQNMDTDNPKFRFYAERVITNLVTHYKDNPAVIGWQIDNETSAYGASNEDVFNGFVNHLKKKFGTTDALNKAWFLNYWGQDVNDWADMPTRDNATSTSYKLEWSRWQQMRVADFLAFQAALVRKSRRPDQFVTQDYGSMMKLDVNEVEVAKSLDVVANNPYHGSQDHLDGAWQALQGDFSRSLKHQNFLVTETNAQTLGWDSAGQFPPYDGQLRLDVYTDLSSGANMVEYWHWHSIHAGQETYWKGVLSHDLEPNRAYAEVSRIAHELQKVGPEIVNLQIRNQVAILYSVDSSNAISFMPFERQELGWVPGKAAGSYNAILSQLHRSLYLANVGADFVFPETADFSPYKLLIVPALYVADDALLKKIADYVHGGGHVLMTFKSGFTNENSAVRWERAPARSVKLLASPIRSSPTSSTRWRSKTTRGMSLPPITRSARGRSSSCRRLPNRSLSTIIHSSVAGRPSLATSSARARLRTKAPRSPTDSSRPLFLMYYASPVSPAPTRTFQELCGSSTVSIEPASGSTTI